MGAPKGNKNAKRRHPGGRPLTYDARLHPVVVRALARCDTNKTEIAKQIGVTTETLYAWSKRYPEFSDALRQNGRAVTDDKVEDSLNRRANGYEYEETEIILADDGSKRIKKTKKVMPPDPASMIFWLKNRRKEKWRDKHEHDVVVEQKPPEKLEALSVDELRTLRELRAKMEQEKIPSGN